LGRPSAARLSLEKSAAAERKRVAEATRSYFFFAVFFAGFLAAFFAGFFFAAVFFTALAKVILLSVHEPNRLDPHSIPTCALTAR
jgi:hypothetical protein